MPGKIQPVTLKLKKSRIKKKLYVLAVPKRIPNTMIGDKLRFDSEDGKFKVEFNRWIFSGKDHPITDRRARTIRERGEYKVDCYIMPPYLKGTKHEKITYIEGQGAHGNVKP